MNLPTAEIPGVEADFAATLSDTGRSMPPAELDAVRVDLTMLDGKPVYQRSERPDGPLDYRSALTRS